MKSSIPAHIMKSTQNTVYTAMEQITYLYFILRECLTVLSSKMNIFSYNLIKGIYFAFTGIKNE